MSAPTTNSLVGEFTLSFHPSVYDPPLYLFPELLPMVEKKPGSRSPPPTADVVDATLGALNRDSSSWRIVGLSAPQDEPLVDLKGDQLDSTDSLAMLVMKGSLRSIGLLPQALSPHTGFSAAKLVHHLDALALHLGQTMKTETDRTMLQKVVRSNHMINILAWQRLEELLGMSSGARAGMFQSTYQPQPTSDSASALGGNDNGLEVGTVPSTDPWQEIYSSNRFVSADVSNAQLHEPAIANLLQLFQKENAQWPTKRSIGAQTADKGSFAGMVRETLPLAKPDLPPLELVDPLVAKQQPKSVWAFASANVWRLEVTSLSELCSSTTLFVEDVMGSRCAFGRAGFDLHSAVNVDLGAFTASPKRISSLHMTLFVQQAGHLSLVVYGKNGVHVNGRTLFPNGALWKVDSTAQFPVALFPVADVKVTLAYQPREE